jgi:peroxiredoxin
MKKIIIAMLVISILIFGCTAQVETEDDDLALKKKIFEQTAEVETHSELLTDDVVEKQTGLKKGNLAPDFEINLPDTGKVTLSSFSEQDKPVLLYFMATWCPYCAKDFTALSEIYPSYHDDVSIIAHSLDLKEKESLLNNYKKKYPGLESMYLLEGKESILKSYGIRFTTTKYAVGGDGTILYSGSGPLSIDQWEVLLEELKNS